ncbi:hypothetical protein NDU88_004090 [Pleurodeles waltl]|uniref:Uncharacterized protein n=1 Tax=Pleurodeles waltl TaxID=8319 RepID=A0AAV7QDV7_PLEWA|nr:hypothetical protein NDU88_004090 [Pleurodeles waltl]
MAPACSGAHLRALSVPVLNVDTGPPWIGVHRFHPLPAQFGACSPDPGRAPWHTVSARSQLTSESASGVQYPICPGANSNSGHRLWSGSVTPGLTSASWVTGPLPAGLAPASESPAARGPSGRWLSGSPIPLGITRLRPEWAPQFFSALSGSPALQLRDAPGLGSGFKG